MSFMPFVSDDQRKWFFANLGSSRYPENSIRRNIYTSSIEAISRIIAEENEAENVSETPKIVKNYGSGDVTDTPTATTNTPVNGRSEYYILKKQREEKFKENENTKDTPICGRSEYYILKKEREERAKGRENHLKNLKNNEIELQKQLVDLQKQLSDLQAEIEILEMT